jgi:hypothetical protein
METREMARFGLVLIAMTAVELAARFCAPSKTTKKTR